MDKIPVFVGLDYHEESIQVCVVDGVGRNLGNKSCPNDRVMVCRYAESFGTVKRVAIEACGGAAEFAEELIMQGGWAVDLAHPGYVARMKQNPDKTDYSDARILADLQRVGFVPRVWLPPREVRDLRLMVRYRLQLVRQRRATKQRIRAVLREQRVRLQSTKAPWTKAWLAVLEQNSELSEAARWVVDRHLNGLKYVNSEISLAEVQLAKMTQNDPLVERLLGKPGIGPVTAWTIRAEIGRFDRFRNGKKLARFCGLSPFNASSGARQSDAGLIKAANGNLRSTLIEAAHRLIRYEPHWRKMADRMMARGKPKSVIAAAVANRWMRRLHHELIPRQQAA